MTNISHKVTKYTKKIDITLCPCGKYSSLETLFFNAKLQRFVKTRRFYENQPVTKSSSQSLHKLPHLPVHDDGLSSQIRNTRQQYVADD